MPESTPVIRPLREDEYDGFIARGMAFYVDDMVRAGIDRDVAQAKADTDLPQLLSEGLATPSHFMYAIEDDGSFAGYLWLCDRDGELGHSLFVYAVEIDEEFRGRGLGRAAMVFAEEEAQRLGIAKVALNVFGGNEVARGLYLSLGYTETAVHMEKRV
ncbi:MAG TPA: GNAT family N-acetyltransferase [Gaiellaceae bacterium]|nr:GNAT family N-acetyltransferase [Gaiellaceae bacterium]